jgi:hypothetical protein
MAARNRQLAFFTHPAKRQPFARELANAVDGGGGGSRGCQTGRKCRPPQHLAGYIFNDNHRCALFLPPAKRAWKFVFRQCSQITPFNLSRFIPMANCARLTAHSHGLRTDSKRAWDSERKQVRSFRKLPLLVEMWLPLDFLSTG